MKKALLAALIVTAFVLAIFVYERLHTHGTFGPSSMLATAGLTGIFLTLLLSYLLFDTRYRELVTRFWLVTMSIVVTFFVADLLAGALLITRLSPQLVPDEYRHHVPVPNSFSKFEQKDFSYVQRTNNLGMRGADVTIEKPPGVYRILMLGDSFTMGKGVENEETFSSLLGQFMSDRSRECAGKEVEVLNGGVDSYAPILSYLQLSKDLHQLSPDMVVLNLDMSDLVQEAAYRQQATFDENGEIVAVPGSVRRDSTTERFRFWIENHLFLTRLLLHHANQLIGYQDLTVRDVVERANAEVIRHTLADDPTDRTPQWEALFDSVAKIQEFSDERGITFILSVYPWAHQLSETEAIPIRYSFMPRDAQVSDRSIGFIERLSAERGIELANLFPHFKAYTGKDELHFHYDMHWTTSGHEVMARGLEGYLSTHHQPEWCE